MKKQVLIAIIIVFCFLTLAGQRSTVAQQTVQYDGLDMLFIVDQSGSMGGAVAGSTVRDKANDPNGMRFYGVQYAMSWLGWDQLFVHPDTTYRMAVLNFGSNAQAVNLGPRELPEYWARITPQSRDDWLLQEADLDFKLSSKIQGLDTNNLGNTNFASTFEEAQSLFAELDARVKTSENHKRAIIILTDGQPWLDGWDKDDPNIATKVVEHMKQVAEKAQSYFPAPQYAIYVVAMRDVNLQYWTETYAGYWAEVTGDPQRARDVKLNETDVGARFQEILLELTQDFPKQSGVTDEEIRPGQHVIPPYLRELMFTFFKADPQGVVQAIDPQQTVYTPTPTISSQARQPGQRPIQQITISNPQPGTWTVVAPKDTEVRITMRKILATGLLQQPAGTQYKLVPGQIAYQIQDSNGIPLPDYADPIYQLQVTTTLKIGGTSSIIYLRHQGQNLYTAEFVPTTLGSHAVHVQATSRDLNNKPITVFDGDLSPFDVRELTIEPRFSGLLLTQYVSTTLQYDLVDSTGQTANVQSPINARLVVTDSQLETYTIPLPVTRGTQLDGDWTPVMTGTHQATLIATTKDSKGNEYTLVNLAQTPLQVLPPVLKISVAPDTLRQHMPVDLELEIQDANGMPMVPGAGYTLYPTAQVGREQDIQKMNFYPVKPGVYTTTFEPASSGEQVLLTTLNITHPATNQHIPLLADQRQLNVLPTELITLRLASSTRHTQPIRSLFFKPLPLVVDVEWVGQNDQAVDPTKIVQGNMDHLLDIEIVDQDGNPQSQTSWKSTGQPGQFRIQAPDLEKGEFTVRIRTTVPLKEGFKFDQSQIVVEIKRIENPILIALAIFLALALLLAIVLTVLKFRREAALKKHPCKGYLVIADRDQKILWQQYLEESLKNYQKFDIESQAPMSLIETLMVTCKTDQDSAAEIVQVQAKLMDKGLWPEKEIKPGQKIELGENIWLLKTSTWTVGDRVPDDIWTNAQQNSQINAQGTGNAP